ncbi:MAG: hypothetical protein AAFZ99_06605 [Pseudomonadota bacterium]
MTEKKSPFGDIEVKMGKNNSVDHIGHKITFHAPPPNPNSILQAGRVVGEIASEPQKTLDGWLFDQIFVDHNFQEDKEFAVQGARLVLEQCAAVGTVMSSGSYPKRTIHKARCKTLTD